MKLKYKIGGGFALVVLLTLFISFVAWNGMRGVKNRIEKETAVVNLVENLKTCRQFEKDFIIEPSEKKHAEELYTMLDKLTKQAEQTKDKFSDQYNKKQMDDVLGAVKNYNKSFTHYVDMEKQKNETMAKMRESANKVLTEAEAIYKDQQQQLLKSREDGAVFLNDKMSKAEDATTLLDFLKDAKALRVQLVIKFDQKQYDEWQAINAKILKLTSELKSRFKLSKNIEQADRILDKYKLYEVSMKKYLKSKAKSDMDTLLEAAKIAASEMMAIDDDQDQQLKDAQVEQELVINDKLAKSHDANQLIKWFLDLRKNEKEYIINQEQKWLDNVNRFIKDISTLSEQLKGRFKFKKNIDQIDGFVRSLASYKNEFDNFTKLMSQQKIAGNDMLDAAMKAEKVCEDAQKDQEHKMESEMALARWEVLIGAIIALVAGTIISLWVVSNILKQLGCEPADISLIASKVAQGDINLNLSEYSSTDIGVFAAIKTMVENLRQTVKVAEEIAQGNLDVDVKLASDNDSLGIALDRMVKDLRNMITQIKEAANQINSGSDQISDASQALSQGATESAASLEEITSSMAEISAQTKTNAENANQANQLTNSARTEAESGEKDVQAMLKAMEQINDSSQQIAKIIKTIDDIAFQTNILALNAAVEAARAGSHGKGFAVVADEVRNLAGRSAKAARETAELIESAGEKVENGQKVAKNTSESFNQIVEGIVKVADLAGEIAAASNEQAQGMNQVNQGLVQIDMVTQQNTANAEETASSSEELSSQATLMSEMMNKFKLRERGVMGAPTPPPRQQALKTPTLAPPSKETENNLGWGNVESKQATNKPIIKNEEIISLEDNEFGRY